MKRCDIPTPFDVQLLEELNDKTSPWKQRVANARALEEIYRTGGGLSCSKKLLPQTDTSLSQCTRRRKKLLTKKQSSSVNVKNKHKEKLATKSKKDFARGAYAHKATAEKNVNVHT